MRVAAAPYTRGVSTKFGTSTNAPNIAKPAMIAVRFVNSTCRAAIIRMSTSGSGTRSSTNTQSTSTITAAASNATTRPDVQPHDGASVSASKSAIKPTESVSAPATSTREDDLIGDSGTNRATSTTDAATGTAPTMNSQRHDRLSTISPASTSPNPPPTPNTAEISPMATPIFSRGNSSRMIANDSGKTAPPSPCTARKPISDQMFHAAAAPTQPTRKSTSETTSSRSFPN